MALSNYYQIIFGLQIQKHIIINNKNMQKAISKELADQILVNREIVKKYTEQQLTNMKWDSYFLRLKKQPLDELVGIFNDEIRRKKGDHRTQKEIVKMQPWSQQNWQTQQMLQDLQKQMQYRDRRQKKRQQEERAYQEQAKKEWDQYQKARLAPGWITRLKNRFVKLFDKPNYSQLEKHKQLEQQSLLKEPFYGQLEQSEHYLTSKQESTIENSKNEKHQKLE